MYPGVLSGNSNGLQILHGLYPWASDSFADLKNSTFFFFGFRALHVGRQKMPVVLTAAKNSPSKEVSFSTRALYMTSSVNKSIFKSK
jgi:hypothetical protein